MMMVGRWRMAVVAALFVLMGAGAAPEMVDNPVYTSWARQKVGTRVVRREVLEQKTASATQPSTAVRQVTQVLQSVSPAVVTLQESSRITWTNGKVMESAGPVTEPAKVKKGTEGLSKFVAEPKLTNLQTAPDTLEVQGKRYAIQHREMDFQMSEFSDAVSGHLILWTSADFPGWVLKSEMRATMQNNGQKAVESLTTSIAEEIPEK